MFAMLEKRPIVNARERERKRELPWIFYSVCLDHIRHAERSLHYGVGCFLGFETMPVHDV